MRMHRTRYSAGNLSFAISSADRSLHDVTHDALRDLRSNEEPVLDIELTHDGEDVLITVSDDSPDSHRRGDFLQALVSLVNRLALDADADRLHLHAAGLARDGDGVVIAATGGTGKSTLAAALGRRGWTYMSDEMISIDGSAEIRGFPKPIALRRSGAELLGDVADRAIHDLGIERHRSFLPASLIPTGFSSHERAQLLVFLDREPDRAAPECDWCQVSPAEATVAAISNSFDFARFGRDALETIADFCLNTVSYSLSVGDLESTAEAIERLLDRRLEPSGGRCSIGPAIGETRSVILNDEAVLHNLSNDMVVSLPPKSCEEWLGLDDSRPTERTELVDELRRLGLLMDAA